MRKTLLIIFLIAVIFVRYNAALTNYEDGQKLRINSTVSTEPVQYSGTQRVMLKGLSFYLPSFPRINYGDKLIVEGVVNDGKLTKVKLIEHNRSESILFKVRNNLVKFYQSSLPEPHSSLIAGMTIGSKASIPDKFWEILKETGTAHVVVASGMNVTLVAMFLINIFIQFIPRTKALWLALLGVWVYALISGFDAPIVRAAVMGSIAFWAQAVGRLSFAWRALILSAFLMLLLKPLWLTDLGFILSFSATVSLMLFEAKIRKRIRYVPSIFREGLSTSLAAQILIAPIMFVTFGQFSLISPLVNALVLWTVPGITMIGMFSGILGLVWPGLGRLLLYLSYPLTSWFVFIVEIFS